MSLIRRSVNNPVAANMLMILILGGGIMAALRIPRELFPEFSVDYISVTVPYRDASPSDIEQSICLKIEEKLTGVDGVDEINATSREGLGQVLLKLKVDADPRKVLDEVKSKVEQVSFPEQAEDYEAIEVTLKTHVIHLAVAGNAPERTLKKLAEEIRDDINDLPEVSQVSVSDEREYEIIVEVSEESLRRYRLTLGNVALAIRQGSFDLPAGTVKTAYGDMTIRIVGQRYQAEEFRDLIVLAKPDGTVVRLGDIAKVTEGFEDLDIGGQFNGQPAVLVSVFKTSDEDTLTITDAVRRYVERKRPQLPEGIVLEPWSDYSKLISDRLNMLVRNGLQGLSLVFLVLWLFLGLRLSFWVAMGIPVSLLGTLLVLNLSGMSLNMMSMFALIMALGLIVDDAIVVGENVYTQVERGRPPRLAAVEGTRSVLLPVIGAVTTTWLAFAPLLLIPGIMGRFIEILPIAVILALAFSLLECLLILPPHLAHSLSRRQAHAPQAGSVIGLAARTRARIDAAIQRFINVHFRWVYQRTTRYRYVTLAVLLAVLVSIALAWRTGRIRFTGFPKVDSDTISAKLIMPTGTNIRQTEIVTRHIARSALKLNQQYAKEYPDGIVLRAYAMLGNTSQGEDRGSHVAEIIVELLPSEQRTVRSEVFTDGWRKNTGPITDAVSLTFGALRGGPGGKSLEIRLLGKSTGLLKPAAEELKTALAGFEGVSDIEDDALPGNLEVRISLKPEARALGIDLLALATQLGGAFRGDIGLEFQRGRDEVKVRVRYPEHRRRSLGDVEDLRVRTPTGAEIPFLEVADVQIKRGYATLHRASNKSVVTVSADVDEAITNAEQIRSDLIDGGFFNDLVRRHPGTTVDFRGQRQQTFESLNALKVYYPIALLAIFTVLAGIFRSYVQPVIIMIVIPFGLVGAVIGHWLLGFDVTLLSLFGMVALTGIVVNDSLVLIDYVNRRIRAGDTVHAAAESGAIRRFRPIFLTTVTTVSGMLPILLERSFQAQFLKPMVVAIAFGLMMATLLTLLAVPSLYLIGNDARRALRWLRTGVWPAPEEVVGRVEPVVEPEAEGVEP